MTPTLSRVLADFDALFKQDQPEPIREPEPTKEEEQTA